MLMGKRTGGRSDLHGECDERQCGANGEDTREPQRADDSSAKQRAAPAPATVKSAIRQPRCCPTKVAAGTPMTVAIETPLKIAASASPRLPGGANRTAHER